MSNIFETARSIRKNIIKARPWKFDGSFKNYSAPEMLQTLIKQIIAGSRNKLETEKRKRYTDQTANKLKFVHRLWKIFKDRDRHC